jgi:phage regulator Rha-like protein
MVKDIIPIERIENKILIVRGQKVILDADLSMLYGVPTKVLNQAIKRNKDRFPEDFMFQLDTKEFEILRSQSVTSSEWGGRRFAPYAFTEHGAIMAANVLNSDKAIEVSVIVVRAFVRLRTILSTNKELAHKLNELERKIESHDETIQSLFDAIRQLMAPPKQKKQEIGFHANYGKKKK